MAEKKTEEKKVEKVKEEKPIDVLDLVSRAFGLPAAGIVIYKDTGRPYINSFGLQYARRRYPTAVDIQGVELKNQYLKIGDMAIAEVRGAYHYYLPGEENLKVDDFTTEVGTAFAPNMNDVSRRYPNEVAITRAINRFLRRALMPYLHDTFMENFKEFNQAEQQLLLDISKEFGSVSIEEIGGDEQAPTEEVILTNEEMEQIKPFLTALPLVETQEDLDKIATAIKTAKATLTDNQLKQLRAIFDRTRKAKNLL